MRTIRRVIALGLALSLSSGCATLMRGAANEALIAVSAEDMESVPDDRIESRITVRETGTMSTMTGTSVKIPLDRRYSYDVAVTAPGHRPAQLRVDQTTSPFWLTWDMAMLILVPVAGGLVGSAVSGSFAPYGSGSTLGALLGELVAIGMLTADVMSGATFEHTPMVASVTLPADRYSGRFEVELADVRRTMLGSAGKAVHLPQPLDPAQGKSLLFQDSRIRLQWTLRPNGLGVSLENRTDRSIKVFWDDAAYVDPTGLSHRLIRDGAGLSDKDHPQVPSVVPANARLADLLVPAEAYEQREGAHDVVLPGLAEGVKGTVDAEAAPFIGKELTVVLPMQVQGVMSDYTFRFRIKGVAVQPVTESPSTWER